MDRGFIGTVPAPTERDDESYLDFVEGVRVFNMTKVQPVMSETIANAAPDANLAGRPIVASRNRLYRSQQEMLWQGVRATYAKRQDELLAQLDRYDRLGPGTVEWRPDFPLPDYFSRVDYHLQPGGYAVDPLAGYVYHLGTKYFFTGRNNLDDVQRTLVNLAPGPADGQVRRVLDLACSVGQSTTAWKERFPQAEVWGIDAGAPMVRYAHRRAVDLGVEVHFKQALAEETGFPSGSFDIVYAFILFHEVPRTVGERVIAEAHRLLRPGGLFIVVDARNLPSGPPSAAQKIIWDFETTDNGEPYMAEFVYWDFTGELRTRFRHVIDDYTQGSFLPMRVAEK
jgi:ubiquinone/menaquinone biosynthesis C-methylase UbiE